ncbi:OST-HTH/LOTUS domain-containing protein (plasmid) [Sinorhizobium meliloti]|uniref:OST-HTH/LOTUS domain-containing protein n=1 Tax=Rhizobium meliloti TaxID=382 RepID=UPI001F39514F|nr:OST-HTH/LOTUS domain-containing protein [Sinorhizobium meliloti]WQP15840.1 OST-HTH/LOTUS domain-containing protein [Sinorhizobium meliloti]WQP29329.1 OST-HTH/LOTUS domain-containing protein [Sinorhizobium meliloti]
MRQVRLFRRAQRRRTGTQSADRPRTKSPQADRRSRSRRADRQASSGKTGARSNGRANLASVGALLAKQAPDFDARTYGFARLSDLVAASGLVDMESTGDRPKIIMVKLKAAPAPK